MSLFELLEQIVGAEGEEVGIKLPEEKINLLSLKILKREAERRGKKLKLKPTGARGKRLIALLEEGVEPEPVRVIKGRFGLPRISLRIEFLRRLASIPFLIFGIFLLLSGGGVYWGLNYLPRAEVFLTLKPVPIVKEIPVSASTETTEIDVEKSVIPGTKITVEESGQKSTPATGTATVGEKAKGTVTFVNCDDTPATFAAGTQIKAEGTNLAYTLDAAVSDVPAISGFTCGTKTGGITATAIGENYNKGEGIEFDFVSYSNEPAYNVIIDSGQSVSGGSSQQVTIVSSADQAKVRGELKKELVEKGKTSLAEQAGTGQVIIQEAIKEEVVGENFLQKVGEQANEVSLTLKLKFTTIAYKEEELQGFISQTLADRIPENYELFPGEMEIEVLEPTLTEKALAFSAKATAQIIPKLDLAAIKNELAGRDAASAQEYLASLANITAYELRLWPNLPENLRKVPRNAERIRVERKTEE